MGKLRSVLHAALLTPGSAKPVAVLRILSAFVLLAQAYFLSGQVFELFGRSGVLQESLSRYLADPSVPSLSPLTMALGGTIGAERAVILTTCVLYLLSLVALLVGWKTRMAAVVAWALHWTLMNTTHSANYGVDMFAHIILFYLMVMPAGATLSLDRILSGKPEVPSAVAMLSWRVLQVHVSIVYFASGFEKAKGAQWWNGDAIWRSVMLPVYNQFEMGWLANLPWLAVAAGILTLVVEGLYPIFAWWPRTRRTWVVATLGLHLGIAVFLGLGVFSAMMAVLNVAAFGFSAELAAAPEKFSESPGGVLIASYNVIPSTVQ